MISAEEILKQYWGYSDFRTPQKEIINAVLNQKKVVALLPTGAGKSICYQVPALLSEGICLVISPLLALMQDQVEHLQKKKIKATYIKPNSTVTEIVALFDNFKFGNYKFLYISPERLQSSLIQEKLKELQISLIAIDEAHCISEWGHDFRPSYREIKKILDQHPQANTIALTATANEQVLKDICNNLCLTKPELFKKSFAKENLAYQVFDVEDKLTLLLQIFSKTKTPAIVYVNSRKKTQDLSNFLNANTFKSSFYHGKLPLDEKQKSFENWMTEQTPIMVATNAFGMGIDKQNVGIVVHFDLPLSIENYIQESGRAGRNSKKSFAVLLKNKNDIELLKERQKKTIPTLSEIKQIHQKLYQYFAIAKGEFLEKSFPFHLSEFSKKYNFNSNKVEFILTILANNSILSFNSTYQKKSTIKFVVDSKKAISYAINNIYINNFINSLLRTYTGLHKQEVKVDEFLLAKKNNTTSSQIISYLQQLRKDGIIEYNAVIADSEIQFLVPREDDKTINRHQKEIVQFIKQKQKKLSDFLSYVENKNVCRSIQILDYFDEISTSNCGICEVCLSKKKPKKIDISSQILNLLKNNKELSSIEIMHQLDSNKNEVLIHLRALIAANTICITAQNNYQLNRK